MSSSAAITPQPALSSAILPAGLLCGTLDITAALVVYGLFGVGPILLLQGIASGLLGHNAYLGGLATAFLGLLLHYFIAFSAATVFILTSRSISFLITHAAIAGPLYGTAVYFFMHWIVLPLSAIPKRHLSLETVLVGVTTHIFCIGLPIAFVNRHYALQQPVAMKP